MDDFLHNELLRFGNEKAKIDRKHKSDVFPHYRERSCLYLSLGLVFLKEISSGMNVRALLKEASEFLKNEFHGIKGVSVKNLRRMIEYAGAYSDSGELLEMSLKIPWTHNSIIVEKCPASKRKYWISVCIRHEISKRFLELLIAKNDICESFSASVDFCDSESSQSSYFLDVPENSSERAVFIKQLENKISEVENAGFSGKMKVCIILGD